MPADRRIVDRRTLAEMFQRGLDVTYITPNLVSVAGIDIEVVEPEEVARLTPILICAPPPGVFPDDVIAACEKCGTPIIHRPYAPAGPRSCWDCRGRWA